MQIISSYIKDDFGPNFIYEYGYYLLTHVSEVGICSVVLQQPLYNNTNRAQKNVQQKVLQQIRLRK